MNNFLSMNYKFIWVCEPVADEKSRAWGKPFLVQAEKLSTLWRCISRDAVTVTDSKSDSR